MRAWRGLLFLLLSAATGLFCTDSAFAQTYPSRPIKIVVPFPPGGPTDVMARLIVQAMSSRLGQSVIIENQSGAGGRSGSKAVAGAAPDGYTLLVGGTNMNAIIPALSQPRLRPGQRVRRRGLDCERRRRHGRRAFNDRGDASGIHPLRQG